MARPANNVCKAAPFHGAHPAYPFGGQPPSFLPSPSPTSLSSLPLHFPFLPSIFLPYLPFSLHPSIFFSCPSPVCRKVDAKCNWEVWVASPVGPGALTLPQIHCWHILSQGIGSGANPFGFFPGKENFI